MESIDLDYSFLSGIPIVDFRLRAFFLSFVQVY